LFQYFGLYNNIVVDFVVMLFCMRYDESNLKDILIIFKNQELKLRSINTVFFIKF